MDTLEHVTHPTAATLVAVDGRTYPLESARLEARAEGGMAFTTLRQTYANPHDEPLEVIYTLPLPADGAVLGYTVQIGEKRIEAEVQPRDQADEEYRRALFEGRTAGLVVQLRDDTFLQKLGNVPPRTGVEIAIEVLHPLAFLTAVPGNDPGAPHGAPEWEYRFPTVTGVRYHGAPGRVHDARAVSPDRDAGGGIPVRIDLALTIGGAPGQPVRSPSHAITQGTLEGATVVGFAAGERLDRDVVLRWDAAGAEVGVTLVEGGGRPGDDGRYGLLTLVPPAVPAAAFARDLTVLIDASGSMSGEPLILARQVVDGLLGSLGEGDRFELLSFASKVRSLTGGLVAWNPASLASARKELAALQASGGTEMASAMEQALASVRERSQRQVVLVTDGEIGFERQVMRAVAAHPRTRVHAVGIGSAPNRTLTRAVATAGHGLELLVGDDESARRAAARLIAGTARPVLTNLQVQGAAVLDGAGVGVDVLAGRPLVSTVELCAEGGELELTADAAATDERWIWRVAVPATGGLSRTTMPLGALHGRTRVTQMESIFATCPSDAEPEIERIAMRHRIASSRTSLVAIAEEPSVDPRAPRRRERLAVEVPAGVSAEGTGLLADQATMIPACLHAAAPESGESRERSIGHARAPWARGREPGPLLLENAHVWRAEPDLVLIEILIPEGGLELPSRAFEVELADGARVKCEVDPGGARGPIEEGLVVRLALRIRSLPEWPSGAQVVVRWTSHVREGFWRQTRRDCVAEFTVPSWVAPGRSGDTA